MDYKDFLIQQQEYEDECSVDEMISNDIENDKLNERENIVLLKNLLNELLSEKQLDILSMLVDNAIESNTDYINDVDEKEKEYWKGYVSDLKEIKGLIK